MLFLFTLSTILPHLSPEHTLKDFHFLHSPRITLTVVIHGFRIARIHGQISVFILSNYITIIWQQLVLTSWALSYFDLRHYPPFWFYHTSLATPSGLPCSSFFSVPSHPFSSYTHSPRSSHGSLPWLWFPSMHWLIFISPGFPVNSRLIYLTAFFKISMQSSKSYLMLQTETLHWSLFLPQCCPYFNSWTTVLVIGRT